ncbi:hypothetical protein [Mucilaginibacter pallidiroseus]|nr:hypothetical protein [Mucilaginibacter pallidiroseus]
MTISSFIKKLWNNIKAMFTKFPGDLQNAVNTAVTITENLKKVIESPAIDILTAIIPGNLDDNLKIALRAAIPKILVNLKLSQKFEDDESSDKVLLNAVTALNKIDGQLKSAYLHNISVLVAQITADGKLTWGDGVFIVEWYYQKKFKKNN